MAALSPVLAIISYPQLVWLYVASDMYIIIIIVQ